MIYWPKSDQENAQHHKLSILLCSSTLFILFFNGVGINGSSQVESNTIQHYINASDGVTGYFISLLHYLNVNDYTEIVLQASGDDFQYYGAHCYFYGWLVA